VLIALGLVLIAVFVARIGVGAIAAELRRLGPESLLILVPYALGTALAGLPWAWLLSKRIRPRTSGVIASRFAASGANALLPLFGFAGEPSRLLWLPRSAHPAGLAAIVVDRLLYNATGGLLLLVGAAVALTTRLPRVVSAGAALIAVFIVGFTFVIFHVISRWGIGGGVQRILHRYLGISSRDRELGAKVDDCIRTLLGKSRSEMFAGVLVHAAARVVLSVEVYVALWSLHAPTGIRDAIVLSTVPVATSLVASSIPSQIGVQEGAQALVCAALGFDPAMGLVLVLLQRLRQLAFVPLTPLLIAAARARSDEEAEPTAQSVLD
jgi:hypothetical protein